MHEPPPPGSRPILHHGLYHAHLRRWLAAVPPDRLLVLLHDDLAADPGDLFARLCRFLGIAEVSTKDGTVRYGPAGLARSSILDRVINGRLAKSARSLLPAVVRGPARRLVRWARRQNTRRPEMPPELRVRLAELYHDDILALGKLIGRDLGTWLPNFHDREPHRIESGPAVGGVHAHEPRFGRPAPWARPCFRQVADEGPGGQRYGDPWRLTPALPRTRGRFVA